MKLVIFWADILSYHIARVKALRVLASEYGHEVFAFALRPRALDVPGINTDSFEIAGIEILCNDPNVAGTYSDISKKQLIAKLDQIQPDVVAIIGYDGKVSRAALGWCRFNDKGAVMMFAGQEKDKPRIFYKEAFKKILVHCFDSVLAGGITHLAYAQKLGMPIDRIHLGYNVVDNDFWHHGADQVRKAPVYWRGKYNLPEKYFLSVGRFIEKKNFDGLIAAYAQYVAQSNSSPYHLIISGDGELFDQITQHVHELNLEDLVHLPGYLNAKELIPLYALASVFILPSSKFEQWGLVVNEAMASGVPVLVSNICGCVPDLVINNSTGYTFDPKDQRELINLMVRMSSKVDLEKMGRDALLHIEKYSPDMFATNLLRASESAVKNAHSRKWRIWPPPQWWL